MQLFPAGKGRQKFVDKLVKVFTKDGQEQWILVHIEIQGYRDDRFAARMFTYFRRIYDRFEMPVTAFAIFTDGNHGFRPPAFSYEFRGTGLT